MTQRSDAWRVVTKQQGGASCCYQPRVPVTQEGTGKQNHCQPLLMWNCSGPPFIFSSFLTSVRSKGAMAKMTGKNVWVWLCECVRMNTSTCARFRHCKRNATAFTCKYDRRRCLNNLSGGGEMRGYQRIAGWRSSWWYAFFVFVFFL